MTPTLKIKKDSLLNKCFDLFQRLEIPKFLNIKGPKLYTILEKLTLLIFKNITNLDYREVVKFTFSNKYMHFTTLQKFASKLSNYLRRQIKKATKLILENLKIKQIAIDGSGFSKTNISSYYERRVGLLKKKRQFDKLSILIDIDSLNILDFNFRIKPRHDIIDGFKLIKNISNVEVLCDTAYFSNEFCKYLFEKNCTPQIKPKKNFKKGFYLKKANKKFDNKTYLKRSLVETSFSILKRKFTDRLFSRKYKTKSLEMNLKILIYNISRSSFFYFNFIFTNKINF